jgi:hypothetical protein
VVAVSFCASVAARPLAAERTEKAINLVRNLESLEDSTMLFNAVI